MQGKPVLQKPAEAANSAGRLDPDGFRRHIAFQTIPPPADLAPCIEHFWIIRWSRGNQPPYVSEQVMHRPFVDLFISLPESGIQCTFLGRKDYLAADEGRILGLRFRPGAFHGFWSGSMASLHDQTLQLTQVFAEADEVFVQRLLRLDDASVLQALADVIRRRLPAPDTQIDLIDQIIRALDADATLGTVKAVAMRFGRSERWIQQLFSEYLGVGLKWLLQRHRLLGAAQYIREHAAIDWAALAYDCGYSSQQHFINDFKRAIGKTPVHYQKSLTKP